MSPLLDPTAATVDGGRVRVEQVEGGGGKRDERRRRWNCNREKKQRDGARPETNRKTKSHPTV